MSRTIHMCIICDIIAYFPRSLPGPTARDGGKIRPAPRSLSFRKFFTPFRAQFLPQDGQPVHHNSGTESPARGAVQNRQADVARNTLLAGGRGSSRASPATVLATAPGRFHDCTRRRCPPIKAAGPAPADGDGCRLQGAGTRPVYDDCCFSSPTISQ
jgi:hypothetical protein